MVTDVKFIPHRRIGYVGYKSPEDATRAVKYHNKSFIRMSRIGVELARSIEEQSTFKTRLNSTNASKTRYGDSKGDLHTEASVDRSKKRKRETVPEDGGKAKLQEFLDVMQAPSKSKTWDNQDATTTQIAAEPTLSAARKGEAKTRYDEEYEPIPKKTKSERKKTPKEENISELLQAEAVVHLQDETTHTAEQSSEVLRQKPSDNVKPASDADWLRSRTSRLLGLIDDDDAIGQNMMSDKGEAHRAASPPNPEHLDTETEFDASAQANEGSNNVDGISLVSPPDSGEEGAISTGRLFVRNLAYTATEEELRQHFERGAYGTIEEVS